MLSLVILFSIFPMVWADAPSTGGWEDHTAVSKYETHVDYNAGDTPDVKSDVIHGTEFSWQNTLNKCAETETPDTFKLTLSVTGDKISPPPVPIVCVLVMDISDSMNKSVSGTDSSIKINELRDSVKEFSSEFLSASPKNYISLVTFASYAQVLPKSSGADFFGGGDIGSINSLMSNLTTPKEPFTGTNIQSGLLEAYTVLSNVTALSNHNGVDLPDEDLNNAEYIVVLMSDGGANEYYLLGNSYSGANTVPPALENYTAENISGALNYSFTGAQNDKDSVIAGFYYGKPWLNDGQTAAMNARNILLGKAQENNSALAVSTPALTHIPILYTVAYDLTSDATLYTPPGQTQGYTLNYWLSQFATSPDYHFQTDDGITLLNIYEDIADKITSPSITAGSIITDTLSDYFEFPTNWFVEAKIGATEYLTNDNIVDSSTGELISAGAGARMSSDNTTLTWVLKQSVGYGVTASITVRIKAKPNAYTDSCDDSVQDGKILTNDDAQLQYWNELKSKTDWLPSDSATSYTAQFVSPKVHVQNRTLQVSKTVYKDPYNSGMSLSGINSVDWVKNTAFNSLDKKALFKITVSNPSAYAAKDVTLTDMVSGPGVSPGGQWIDGDGNPTEAFDIGGRTGSDMPSKTFYYATGNLPDAGAYTNTATINSDAGSNSDSATVLVAEPQISVDKTVYNPDTKQFDKSAVLNSGDAARFKVTVTNTGKVVTNYLSLTDEITGDSVDIPIKEDNIESITLNGGAPPENFKIDSFALNPNDVLVITYSIELSGDLGNEWTLDTSAVLSNLSEDDQNTVSELQAEIAAAQTDLGVRNDVLSNDGTGSLYAVYNAAKTAYESNSAAVPFSAASAQIAQIPSTTTETTAAIQNSTAPSTIPEDGVTEAAKVIDTTTAETDIQMTEPTTEQESATAASDVSTTANLVEAQIAGLLGYKSADDAASTSDTCVTESETSMKINTDTTEPTLDNDENKDNTDTTESTTAGIVGAAGMVTWAFTGTTIAYEAPTVTIPSVTFATTAPTTLAPTATAAQTTTADPSVVLAAVEKAYKDAQTAVQDKIAEIEKLDAQLQGIIKTARDELLLSQAPESKYFTNTATVTDKTTAIDNSSSADIEVKPVLQSAVAVDKYVIDAGGKRQKDLTLPSAAGGVTFEIDITNNGTITKQISVADQFEDNTITFSDENIISPDGVVFNDDGTLTVYPGDKITLRFTDNTLPENTDPEDKIYTNTVTITYDDGNSTDTSSATVTVSGVSTVELTVTKDVAIYDPTEGDYSNFDYSYGHGTPLDLPYADSQAIYKVTIHNSGNSKGAFALSDSLDGNPVYLTDFVELSGSAYLPVSEDDNTIAPDDTRYLYYITEPGELPLGRTQISGNFITNTVILTYGDKSAESSVEVTTRDTPDITVTKEAAQYKGDGVNYNDGSYGYTSDDVQLDPDTKAVFRIEIINNGNETVTFDFADTFAGHPIADLSDFIELTGAYSQIKASGNTIKSGDTRILYYKTDTLGADTKFTNIVKVTPRGGNMITAQASVITPPTPSEGRLTVTKKVAQYEPGNNNYDSYGYQSGDNIVFDGNVKAVYQITLTNEGDKAVNFTFSDILDDKDGNPEAIPLSEFDEGSYGHSAAGIVTITGHNHYVFYYITPDTYPPGINSDNPDMKSVVNTVTVTDDGNTSDYATDSVAFTTKNPPVDGELSVIKSVAQYINGENDFNNDEVYTYTKGLLNLTTTDNATAPPCAVYKIEITNPGETDIRFDFSDDLDGNTVEFTDLLQEDADGQLGGVSALANIIYAGETRTFYYPAFELQSGRNPDNPNLDLDKQYILNTVTVTDKNNSDNSGSDSVKVTTPDSDITVTKTVAEYIPGNEIYGDSIYSYQSGINFDKSNVQVVYKVFIQNNNNYDIQQFSLDDFFDSTSSTPAHLTLSDLKELSNTTEKYDPVTRDTITAKGSRVLYYKTGILPNGRNGDDPIVNEVTITEGATSISASVAVTTPTVDDFTLVKSVAQYTGNTDYSSYTYVDELNNLQPNSQVIYRIELTNNTAVQTTFTFSDKFDGKTVSFDSMYEGDRNVADGFTIDAHTTRTFYFVSSKLEGGRNANNTDPAKQSIVNTVTVTPKDKPTLTSSATVTTTGSVVPPVVDTPLTVTKSVAQYIAGKNDYTNPVYQYQTSTQTTPVPLSYNAIAVYKITITNPNTEQVTFDFADTFNGVSDAVTPIAPTAFSEPGIKTGYEPLSAESNTINAGDTRTFYYKTPQLQNGRTSTNPIVNTVTVTQGETEIPAQVEVTTPDNDNIDNILTVVKSVAKYSVSNPDYKSYTYTTGTLDLANGSQAVYRIVITNKTGDPISFKLSDIFDSTSAAPTTLALTDLWILSSGTTYAHPSLTDNTVPKNDYIILYYVTPAGKLQNDRNSNNTALNSALRSIINRVTVTYVNISGIDSGSVSSQVAVTTTGAVTPPKPPVVDTNPLTVTKSVAPYTADRDYSLYPYQTNTLTMPYNSQVVYRITITNNSSAQVTFTFSDLLNNTSATPISINLGDDRLREWSSAANSYVAATGNTIAAGVTRTFYFYTTLTSSAANPFVNAVTVTPSGGSPITASVSVTLTYPYIPPTTTTGSPYYPPYYPPTTTYTPAGTYTTAPQTVTTQYTTEASATNPTQPSISNPTNPTWPQFSTIPTEETGYFTETGVPLATFPTDGDNSNTNNYTPSKQNPVTGDNIYPILLILLISAATFVFIQMSFRKDKRDKKY